MMHIFKPYIFVLKKYTGIFWDGLLSLLLSLLFFLIFKSLYILNLRKQEIRAANII